MTWVTVQVLDGNGRVLQELRPQDDSDAWFPEGVPLGRYSVRTEPELARRGRLLAGGEAAVTLIPVQRCARCAEIISRGVGPPEILP